MQPHHREQAMANLAGLFTPEGLDLAGSLWAAEAWVEHQQFVHPEPVVQPGNSRRRKRRNFMVYAKKAMQEEACSNERI
jgi:hypothetical protein